MIRNVQASDAAPICDIYNHHVLHTIVTFEEQPVSVDEMSGRIKAISSEYPWLVYEMDGNIVGYAYASQWKVRSAYRYTVESSVYIVEGYTGKGIGKQLYVKLIEMLKDQGIHAVIGGMGLPNEASLRLHESVGFKKIGQFHEVGWKFDKWVDVGYWELLL